MQQIQKQRVAADLVDRRQLPMLYGLKKSAVQHQRRSLVAR